MARIDLVSEPGIQPYGGADLSVAFSGDGSIFWSFQSLGDHGQVVMRQVPGQGHSTLALAPGVSGRGKLQVGLDGLYLAAWNDRENNGSNRNCPAAVYRVPGFVAPAGGGGEVFTVVPSPPADVAALEAKIVDLERRLSEATALASAAMDRANYVKGLVDDANARLGEVAARSVGISRDEAWGLAKDSLYVELGVSNSGVYNRVKAIAQDVVPATGADVTELRNAVTLLEKTRPTLDDVRREIQNALATLWQGWSTYTDKRLLNLIWDRTVKLLRHKESAGKTAEELPVNDPANLSV